MATKRGGDGAVNKYTLNVIKVISDINSNQSVTTLGCQINPHGNHNENNIENTQKEFRHFTSKISTEPIYDRTTGNQGQKRYKVYRKQTAK